MSGTDQTRAEMPGPEMPRLVEAGKVPQHGLRLTVEATPKEREVLAARFGINEVRSLKADVEIRPMASGFELTGKMTAEVVQACVISSHPVEQTVEETLQLRFSPDVEISEEELELAEGDLDVLPLEGDAMDVGEAIAETLALALDPYPRASEEALAEVRRFLLTEEEDRMARSPFSALAQKRDNPDQKG